MRCFWDSRQLAHAPALEIHNGRFEACSETPSRAQAILNALVETEPPKDHGEAPILRVHTADYVEFLKTAHTDWAAAGREGDALPYTFPVVRRGQLRLDRIDARLGRYAYDTCTPITAESWISAYWSAQTALSALEAVMEGERTGFALCRPPGHHAGSDYFGGYCFLNTAAIAAEAAIAAGRARIAILDIDYHHGNGTQDIFYGRGDVFFASIHADPATDYPFYWGHPDETGEAEGKGATLNLPLPRGAGMAEFGAAIDRALEAISSFRPALVICSYGADTYAGDPISHFLIETSDYSVIAGRIAALELPTLVVMEGGYAVDALGKNVAGFLEGFPASSKGAHSRPFGNSSAQ
jgi:acetoin utilization deacetylase AcuC-like enzyme